MNKITERDAVKLVAKLSPWLAPLPSAFFVARSSVTHLALPWLVGLVVAVIIECLGLSSFNTVLWLSDWNHTKRKTDPTAPTVIALALGAVYLVTTLGLIVALEVWPNLAAYAPAMFPLLAVVGTVNLALIAGQERREAAVATEKAERKAERQAKRQAATVAPKHDIVVTESRHLSRQERLDAIRRANLSRNGDGPMTVAEIVTMFGVSLRQAQRDVADLTPDAMTVAPETASLSVN